MANKRQEWIPHAYPLQSSPSQKKKEQPAATPNGSHKAPPRQHKPIYPIHSSWPVQDPAPSQHDSVSTTSARSRPGSQHFAAMKPPYPIQSPPAEKPPEPVEEIVAVSTARISRHNTVKIREHAAYPIQSSPPSRKSSHRVNAPSAYPMQTSPSSDYADSQRPGTSSTAVESSDPSKTPKITTELPKYLRAARNGHDKQPRGRTILICLDGTGDQFDADNSNIVHLVSCLKKDDPSQITYYQSGVGTYDGGGLSNGMSAAADMAIASGLGVHIRDAYRFLMQNYNEGDRICLFGFSRGAYTARCLAGMVHKVGLLPAHNTSQVAFAYKFYKDDSPDGWRSSIEFKKTFCMDVNIYFVGVFDSVASVGFIPRKLPLSSTPYNRAAYFRHAMALDERRAKFKPCRYQKRDTIGRSGWQTLALTPTVNRNPPKSFVADSATSDSNEQDLEEKEEEAKPNPPTIHETDVLEVWFAGCHCDVGGGAVRNEVRHKLAQIPLRWMIRQCFECDTGILFHTRRLVEKGMDVHTLWPTYTALTEPDSGPSSVTLEKHKKNRLGPIEKRAEALHAAKSGDGYSIVWSPDNPDQPHWVTEQEEDHFDAMQDIHDQLSLAKTWWILELFWPIKVRVQPKESDAWIKKVSINHGRYRAVTEAEPNLHWTVQRRMADAGYTMRTRADRNALWKTVV